MSEYNRHKWAMEWMHGGGRDPNGRGLDEEIQIADDMWKERVSMAEGGTPQLVQPGPGRPGYQGTKTKAEIDAMVSTRDERRKLYKENNLTVEGKPMTRKRKAVLGEDLYTQIDDYITETTKAAQDLSRKGIGEALGYKKVKKGQSMGQGSINKVIAAYEKERGIDLSPRLKDYKLTKDSAWVKEVIKTRKETGSTRATAKALGVDRKTVRNILHQFDKELIGEANLRQSNKWNYKKVRAQRERELIKRLGGKDNVAVQQYMKLWDDVVDMNEDILEMSDDAIWKNERIRQSMNLDVTGLKAGEGINFDKYKNLSKKEFAAKVKDMASKNSFYTAEHSIPIASEKLAAGFPKNIQVASGKIGDQLEAIKLYIKNNPDGKHIPAVNEFLEEFDIQIREGGKTYGWNNPRDKTGLNVFRTDTGTSDIVQSAINKSQTGTINNSKLRNIPKAKVPFQYPVSSLGAAGMDDLLKSKGAKKIGNIARKTLLSEWVWPEVAIAGAEFINRKQKGQGERALGETLELASLGLYDSGATEEQILNQAEALNWSEKDIRAVKELMRYKKLGQEIRGAENTLEAMELGAVEQGTEEGAEAMRAKIADLKKTQEAVSGFYFGAIGDKPANYGNELFGKAVNSLAEQEFQATIDDRMTRRDPYAGGIGNWLNNNIFTLNAPERRAEQQRIDAMDEDELRQFNIDRGVIPRGPLYGAYDEKKYEDLYDSLGYMYKAGGGITTLDPRRPNAIPPKSGPMPQGGGLSYMYNRVKKLTE